LQAAGIRRIDSSCGDSAESGTTSNGHHVPCSRSYLPDPLEHRLTTAGKAMIRTRPLRPTQQGSFDAQDIHGTATIRTLRDHLSRLIDAGLRNTGMPEQLNTLIREHLKQGTVLVT
jgi:hypothetical protein